ncbi:MAG: rod shape-determining protein RodA [Alistipes sp.]|nr:rod shape-determining protein RodA [Alistipes sp.]
MFDSSPEGLFSGIDRVALLLYVLLVAAGFVCITAASYDDTIETLFSSSHFYMKQLMWIGISWVVALVLLLIDEKYFHMLAYPLYILGIASLVAVLMFGREVNGAKAWFEFGGVRIQPVEFVKIATSLTLARVMSAYSFSISRPSDIAKVAAVILLPLGIIVLQNDTGSGIVLCSLLFVLYREGLSRALCMPLVLIAFLFIFSFILEPLPLFLILLTALVAYSAARSGAWAAHVRFLAFTLLASLLLAVATPLSGYAALMIVCGIEAAVLAVAAIQNKAYELLWLTAMFVGATIFVPTTDYIFDHVLKPHQQDRVLSFVGMKSDPLGIDYNVNQSQIAIGSGGFAGKGFLQGTQIKYNFVPEKHTDFIFCTLGEEWGFVGTMIVLGLFIALIMRLMKMGERIKEPFGRIYCYCVASILLFHVLVNVGMTIGLMPVMGIPLPLMSYGGSSLVAFTILIIIAIRLDASTKHESSML